MTAMLASVTTIDEAGIALRGGADLIDLKDPTSGALGRLETQVIRSIVKSIGGKRPVSATIGDQPMQPGVIVGLVEEIAATGIDYVKIGLVADESGLSVIRALASLTRQFRLIAVFFADQNIDAIQFNALQGGGFTGVMLDTFDKGKGSLRSVASTAQIARFVNETQARNLLCGLAGSLKQNDIAPLVALQPDYLGFRGALCFGRNRIAAIDENLVDAVKNAILQASGICATSTP
jgi:(5-formylfuran-3-yl)methyl phosphate synthase